MAALGAAIRAPDPRATVIPGLIWPR